MSNEPLSEPGADQRADAYESAYTAYETRPLDEPDAWGDLASFLEAASAS